MTQIKKAVILAAGLGTRFLPYSRVIPKEFFPLGNRPVIEYIVEEAYLSGIDEIIFVLNPDRQHIVLYFQDDKTIREKIWSKNDQKMKDDYCRLRNFFKKISFSYVYQDLPKGDGISVLKAKDLIKNDEAVAVMFCDDVVYTKKDPALKQLIKAYQKYKAPIVSLAKVDDEKVSSYGMVKREKISDRASLLKGWVEKPQKEEAPSNLAFVGKCIITPEVLKYLEKAEKDEQKDEIRLADAFTLMIEDNKKVIGYEFEGKWLECGTLRDWLKSNFFITQKMVK